MKNPDELYFNEPDTDTWCRAGGNGPAHPSQLYALKKYGKEGMSLLDIGCGSATTYEAIKTAGMTFDYTGIDMIPKHIAWDKKTFPEGKFEVMDGEEIPYPDQSFDIVYSRHVVDHMPSFEKALDEHCRLSKNLVIIILWYQMSDQNEEDDIKNITYGKTYTTEYLNQYSKKKSLEIIENKQGWKLLEFTENIRGNGPAACFDTVIVLQRT